MPGPFLCASYSYEDPLSRSYGVSLPNSLTVSLPSALVYSTRPRVSVYGTGRVALKFSGFSWQHDYLRCHPAPEGRAYSRASDQGVDFPAPLNSFALKPPIPSGGGSVTPRSQLSLQCEYWNINQLVIRFPSRVPLSPRLTLIRLTLFTKPWVFGVHISICIIVTYAYIFFSRRSSRTHVPPSTLTGMLPYHTYLRTCP